MQSLVKTIPSRNGRIESLCRLLIILSKVSKITLLQDPFFPDCLEVAGAALSW